MSGTENEAVQAGAKAYHAYIRQGSASLPAWDEMTPERQERWLEDAQVHYDAMRPIIERATAERLGKDAVAALAYQNHRDAVHVADLKAAVEAARAEERERIHNALEDKFDNIDFGHWWAISHRAECIVDEVCGGERAQG